MRPRSIFEILEPRRLLSGAPAITIGDVSLSEGQNGVTSYVFTVSLSNASSKRVSVKSVGADRRPDAVMTQPEPVRESVTCSRPTCVPRMKMLNVASPGVGAGGACCAGAAMTVIVKSKAAAARAVQ